MLIRFHLPSALKVLAALFLPGVPPALPADTVTVALPPTHDAQVREQASYKGANYGANPTFLVCQPSVEDKYSAYLRFDLSGIAGTTITSAKLKLFCNSASTASHSLYVVSNDAWTESSVSANNRPDLEPAASTFVSSWTPAAGIKEFDDIAGFVQTQNAGAGRMITFRIASDGIDAYPKGTYSSKEHATVANRPVLEITYIPGPPPPLPLLASNEEVNNAVLTVKPGETLTLKDGTYNAFTTRLINAGTESAPIAFTAQTPGKVTFTGASSIAVQGDYNIVSGFVFDKVTGGTVVNFTGTKHSRLTDCAFLDCGIEGNPYTHLIEVTQGAQWNRFDHVYMTGNKGMGMGLRVNPRDQLNQDNQFDHNWFHNIARAPGGNGRESIQLGQGPPSAAGWPAGSPAVDSTIRATIEYNLFEHAEGDPEIVSMKGHENTVRFNTFRDNKHCTVNSHGGSKNRIEGNYFFNTRGIRAGGNDNVIINNYLEGPEYGIVLAAGAEKGGYKAAINVLLAHNTIINGAQSGIVFGDHYGKDPYQTGNIHTIMPTGRVYNNISQVASTKKPYGNVGPVPAELLFSNNIAWRLGGSTPWGLTNDGIAQINPGFSADLIHGLRRFDSTSPACNAGRTEAVAATDVDGQTRDGQPDIGADEISGAEILTPPLTPASVGPEWMNGNPSIIVRVP